MCELTWIETAACGADSSLWCSIEHTTPATLLGRGARGLRRFCNNSAALRLHPICNLGQQDNAVSVKWSLVVCPTALFCQAAQSAPRGALGFGAPPGMASSCTDLPASHLGLTRLVELVCCGRKQIGSSALVIFCPFILALHCLSWPVAGAQTVSTRAARKLDLVAA